MKRVCTFILETLLAAVSRKEGVSDHVMIHRSLKTSCLFIPLTIPNITEASS